MRLTQELLNVVEAKNHLGETTYSSYASWKQACKKKNPNVWFEGDKDIAQAMVGPQPYKRGETKAIGEWDGNEGSVYTEQVKEEMTPLSKLKPGMKIRWVEDGDEKIGTIVADPKYNGGMRIGGRSVKNIFDQGSTTELTIIKEDAEYAKKLVRGEKYGPGVLNKIDQFITWKLMFQKEKNRFLPVAQATKQLKLAGFSGEQIHKIRDAAAQAGFAAMEYVMKKYPNEVPAKYTGPNNGAFQVYDLYLNVGEKIRHEFSEKFQKLFDLKIKKIESQLKIIKEAKEEQDLGPTADKCDVGDTVVISGNVEFKDSVGEIVSFGKDKKFVVVKLFGKNTQHSFHSSDVTLEKSDEDDEKDTDDNDTTFYVAIYDEDEHKSFIGSISKEGGKWHETAEKGEEPYAWGGSSYMSYLSAHEVMQWIHKDYGRHNEVAGPFNTLEDAEEYVERNWGHELTEAARDTFHLSPAIGKVTKKFKSFLDFKAAVQAEYGSVQKRNLPGKIYYLKDDKKLAVWDDFESVGIVYYKDQAPVTEESIWDKKFTDFDTWKQAVLHSYPAQAKKMKFKGRFEGGKHTISAEVPGEDRSYGVWDGEEDYGKVLSEGSVYSVKNNIKGKKRKLALPPERQEPANAEGGESVTEGKWTVNARTGAKLDPRTGKELPPIEKPVSKKQMFAPKPRPVAAKPDLDKIWRKVEEIVSNIFPDGDPIDWLAPWMRKQGWDYSYVEKAAKKHGYKDVYDYWDDLKKEYGETMQEGVKSTESYNDDDWYEYDPKTMKIIRQSGPSTYRYGVKGSHFDLPNGNKVITGMAAKHKLKLHEAADGEILEVVNKAHADHGAPKKVFFTGKYDECIAFMKKHKSLKLDLMYKESGRLASYVLK